MPFGVVTVVVAPAAQVALDVVPVVRVVPQVVAFGVVPHVVALGVVPVCVVPHVVAFGVVAVHVIPAEAFLLGHDVLPFGSRNSGLSM
jgi:hypothetical protein